MTGADTTHDAHAAAEATDGHAAGAHGHADHGGSSDGAHDSAHAQEPLGPVDWPAWGFALLGAAAAGVIALSLYLASTASS